MKEFELPIFRVKVLKTLYDFRHSLVDGTEDFVETEALAKALNTEDVSGVKFNCRELAKLGLVDSFKTTDAVFRLSSKGEKYYKKFLKG